MLFSTLGIGKDVRPNANTLVKIKNVMAPATCCQRKLFSVVGQSHVTQSTDAKRHNTRVIV